MFRKVFILFFLMVFLSGCQEVEKPVRETDTGQDALAEDIDLSRVSAPEKAVVYSAGYWERDPEDVARIFLGTDYREEEACAEGRVFSPVPGQKHGEKQTLTVFDGGRAFFGSTRRAPEGGLAFSDGKLDGHLQENREYETIIQAYGMTGEVPGGADGETVSKQVEKTEAFLDRLGMSGYRFHDAALFSTDREGETGCLMYWRQVVDGIPLSKTVLQNYNHTVYNYRAQICSPDLQAYNTTLQVVYAGDGLGEWYNSYVAEPDRKLKEYPVITADEACRKVRERYPAAAAAKKACLRQAELQYEFVELQGNCYLYPVWVFGVTEKDTEWWYFLVDAVTGEFFAGIPAELQLPES